MEAPLPPPAKPLCPASLTAEVQAEPAPPSGIGAAALHAAVGDPFYEWLAVTYPTWARELAKRLDDAKADCKAAEDHQ